MFMISIHNLVSRLGSPVHPQSNRIGGTIDRLPILTVITTHRYARAAFQNPHGPDYAVPKAVSSRLNRIIENILSFDTYTEGTLEALRVLLPEKVV